MLSFFFVSVLAATPLSEWKTKPTAENLLKAIPQTATEFRTTCQTEGEDCLGLFEAMEPLLKDAKQSPLLTRKLLVLAAQVRYDADAPFYMQSRLREICLQNTAVFVEGLNALKTEKERRTALEFLTYTIRGKNTHPEAKACSEAITKKGSATKR